MNQLLVELREAIAILTINRQETLNALSSSLLEALLDFLSSPPPGTKVIILTGVDRAFIAGADIKEIHRFGPREMSQFCELGAKVADLLEKGPYVTIAAINGYALGGGLEMALACDCLYASEKALLGLPEVTLGLIPGFGGTQRLTRQIGLHRAKEMIFTGKKLSAKEAFELGIVNRVFKAEDLLQECIKIGETIVSNSFDAVLLAKRAINSQGNFELEKQSCAFCFTTQERQRRMNDFVNKGG